MVLKVATRNREPENSESSYPMTPYRLFEDFFSDWAARSRPQHREAWRPAVDILEQEGKLVLLAELPGMTEKQFGIQVEANVLTLSGERKPEEDLDSNSYYRIENLYGKFSRSFTLPDSADTAKISAAYKNGVLRITIPQKPESQPRTIKVSF